VAFKKLEHRGGPHDGEFFEGEWPENVWAYKGDRPNAKDVRVHVYTLKRDEQGNEWLQYEGEEG
jgi:hypothetical protein